MRNKIRNPKSEIRNKLKISNDQNSKLFWLLEFGKFRFPSNFVLRSSNFSQEGQIAVVLLLFVLVAVTIGLAVTQRSLSSITSSNQNEQSTRAFSAAEAGIEKSINEIPIIAAPTNQSLTAADLGNQSQTQTKIISQLPKAGQILEYPPIGKDTIAQFWLAGPANTTLTWDPVVTDPANPRFFYGGHTIDVFYGKTPTPVSEGTNLPALEVNLISFDGTNYISSRNFYDSNTIRRAGNGFSQPTSCTVSSQNTTSSVSNTPDRDFLCRVSFTITGTPIMIRARILYSNIKQPVAVGPPASGCGSRCSLPQQAAIYSAVGSAGQSQKTLQVFRETNFLPSFLDFAIFSSGVIQK